MALECASAGEVSALCGRARHVGSYLIGGHRFAFRRKLGCRWTPRYGLGLLLRRYRLFEVVVDAEEAYHLVHFVADEDAAAFDELAAIVAGQVVVNSVFIFVVLGLQHVEAEVCHGAAGSASRNMPVLTEHHGVLRHGDVVKVHLVVGAQHLGEAADDGNENLEPGVHFNVLRHLHDLRPLLFYSNLVRMGTIF